MTEDEAKTKACPFAATFGASQQLAEGPGPHCIGSACMAWRWLDDAEQIPTDEKCERCQGAGVCVVGSGEDVGGDDCPDCGGAGYIFTAVGTGYCGLAGKP